MAERKEVVEAFGGRERSGEARQVWYESLSKTRDERGWRERREVARAKGERRDLDYVFVYFDFPPFLDRGGVTGRPTEKERMRGSVSFPSQEQA